MPTLDELASRYQSRRVASDVLAGRRPNIDREHWWWWDAALGLERIERERASERYTVSAKLNWLPKSKPTPIDD